ncbi:DUF3800 domain-containing protein [Methylacidimicrobium sp. B4]|uniref:DUF3800 domain-containing protein n=1 Tax=Methylacidimicrobium sp. B4 TaxID=2796139 RepID=UPI001A8E6C97|nr:DUF3800 domain-containing protein [Methylacidimicrobium sp. B4]QSR84675.1 DUF3800 domain-containing protein [Methylacidimicrobium sp. B4]
MFLVFVDECGYEENWQTESNIRNQPVHVVAAAAIDSNELERIYTKIRSSVRACDLPHTNADLLGMGEEIKAAPLDRGKGFWGKHTKCKNQVRQSYLDHREVTYFVVCVDKARHKAKYKEPKDPAYYGLKLFLERVQGFAEDMRIQAFVLIDINKRDEPKQRNEVTNLVLEGSSGQGSDKFYGMIYQWKLKITNVLEIHFVDSKYSLGLQIADFVARCAYSWWKSGEKQDHPGWSLIEHRLYKYPDHRGWGYKEVPS